MDEANGYRNPAVADDPLYARLLGDAWSRLPVEIRDMHRSAVRAPGPRDRRTRHPPPCAAPGRPDPALSQDSCRYSHQRAVRRLQRRRNLDEKLRRRPAVEPAIRRSRPNGRACFASNSARSPFRHGARCGRRPAVACVASLVRLRHSAADVAGSARRRLRNGEGRPLPVSRRDKPSPDRRDRPLSRLARPAAA